MIIFLFCTNLHKWCSRWAVVIPRYSIKIRSPTQNSCTYSHLVATTFCIKSLNIGSNPVISIQRGRQSNRPCTIELKFRLYTFEKFTINLNNDIQLHRTTKRMTYIITIFYCIARTSDPYFLWSICNTSWATCSRYTYSNTWMLIKYYL